MARYVLPDVGRKHIDDCVQLWKVQCLLQDGSLLLDDAPVWTLGNLADFRHRFLEGAIYGTDESFDEKLTRQLEGAGDEVRWLATELLLIYFLPIWKQVGPPRKSQP